MKKTEDPRIAATRSAALDAALDILQKEGVFAVTHAAVNKATGISRSTLYRHWPETRRFLIDTFKHASGPTKLEPAANGPLRADLKWHLIHLVNALNESPWGKVAAQIIAAAATDKEAQLLINELMGERFAFVENTFIAAQARNEIASDAPIRQLIELMISVPYFRKLILGAPLDEDWIESHIEFICSLAENSPDYLLEQS